MKNELRDKINFTRFCINYKVDPLELAELIELIELIVRSQANESDKGKNRLAVIATNRLRPKIESLIQKLEWTIEGWPGLYPSIKDKNGYDINLPY